MYSFPETISCTDIVIPFQRLFHIQIYVFLSRDYVKSRYISFFPETISYTDLFIHFHRLWRIQIYLFFFLFQEMYSFPEIIIYLCIYIYLCVHIRDYLIFIYRSYIFGVRITSNRQFVRARKLTNAKVYKP